MVTCQIPPGGAPIRLTVRGGAPKARLPSGGARQGAKVNERDGFEERLRQARSKQGLDKPPAERGKAPQSPWGFGLRAGVEVVSALVVGIGIGFWLDRWLGTWPWLFLVFFVMGSAAGILNVYRLFNPRPRSRARSE